MHISLQEFARGLVYKVKTSVFEIEEVGSIPTSPANAPLLQLAERPDLKSVLCIGSNPIWSTKY